MSQARYLTFEEALVLCAVLGDLKVRDPGLLDSALHRPRTRFAGVEFYPSIERKAAALLHSLVRNHSLYDGNKRLAWMACDVFLARHGLRSGLSVKEAFDLMLAVAGDKTIDVDAIAERLAVKPISDVE